MAALLLASVLASVASAAPQPYGCTKGSEYDPPLCPLQLPPITGVLIDPAGANASATAAPAEENCDAFVLSGRQVSDYFKKARCADPEAIHATLAESPCRVAGQIRFRGGATGRWTIDRYGVGRLQRPGLPDTGLVCRKCSALPFLPQ